MLVGSGAKDGLLAQKNLPAFEDVGKYQCVEMSNVGSFIQSASGRLQEIDKSRGKELYQH